jgi:hypothetical protein
MKLPYALPLMLIFALAACGNQPAQPGPGGVSADDAEALDEAAAKLDAEASGQSDSR